MPQLAPLSWVFLSFGVFFLVFVMFMGGWWMKKNVLVLKSGGDNDNLLYFVWFW